MANLTYLNDASVLHNLRSRYERWLIYVCTPLIRIDLFNHFLFRLCFSPDLFGSILCHHQSVQTLANLYNESCVDVSWQETNRSSTTFVCHFWQCIFEYASWYVERVCISLSSKKLKLMIDVYTYYPPIDIVHLSADSSTSCGGVLTARLFNIYQRHPHFNTKRTKVLRRQMTLKKRNVSHLNSSSPLCLLTPGNTSSSVTTRVKDKIDSLARV